jgi:SpoVK/Ycf46/Vps4 family AAA+-type ATPase
VLRTLQGVSHLQIDLPGPDPLVDAVMGLTAAEAERAILREALADGRLEEQDAANIRRLRAELLSRESPLNLMDPGVTLDDAGGLDNLKEWLRIRRRGLEPAARHYGLPAPRGILLVGVPGCGKSLIAKGVAGSWGLPLAALDTGQLHGSLVGESERRIRAALDSVEVMSPVVLWIDEIEKAFGASGGERDGGVAQRVMGVLLGWLQERPDGVFVVATSNDVQALPPELLRRGRFDEIFFVDLPEAPQRTAILERLLWARGRDPRTFDVPALVAATEGFSGAELDSAVTSALYIGYSAGRPLDDAMLLTEIGRSVPLSRLRAEDITALRAWAGGRARPA